jgi:hypothetical protein
MNQVAGVIYPVPLQYVERLLVEKRNVFVKYVRTTGSLRLAKKDKVLFYASQSSKKIVGEGKIENLEFLTPSEALKKYGNKLFIGAEELEVYRKKQPKRDSSKKMLILFLSNLRYYRESKNFKTPITMAGRYITKDEYSELFAVQPIL